MQVEPHDWTVPAPLRALLWWPPLAFLVVLLDPTAAAGTIAVVGGALAVLGVLGAAVGGIVARRLAQRHTAADAPAGPPLILAAEPAPSTVVEPRAA